MLEGVEIRFDKERECGWREEGGLYLILPEFTGRPCGKLPIEAKTCPVCSCGIKFSRGWTWIDPDKLFEGEVCEDPTPGCLTCPLSDANKPMGRSGLIWIGEKTYKTPDIWLKEAKEQGISRRLPAVPTDIEIGKTWVLVAHNKCIEWFNPETQKPDFKPGIFSVFRPKAIEYVVKPDDTQEKIDALIKRGVTPVTIVKVDKDGNLLADEEIEDNSWEDGKDE